MHSSHYDDRFVGRRIVLMEQNPFYQFSGSFNLYCFSQLFQQIGTIFPVISSAFLKVICEHNVLCISETDAITSLLMGRPLPSLEGVILDASTASIVFWSLAQSDGRGGRVLRWCWVNFQCQDVLQFGLQ